MSHGRTRTRRRARTLAPAALGLAALALGAVPVQAAFPGKNGRIAFATQYLDEYGNVTRSQITWVNPDGSASQILPTCPRGQTCVDGAPTFAPGGQYLAFASANQSGGTLGFLRTNFSGLDRYPRQTFSDSQPAWGPSGQRLIFTGASSRAAVTNGRTNLYTLGCIECGRKRITFSGGYSQPAWSRRDQIVFTKAGNLWLRTNGSARRFTGKGGSQASFSPYGTKLVFVRKGNLFSIGVNGRGIKRLTGAGGSAPAWSPDGTRIAFVRGGALHTMSATGGSLVKVATPVSGTVLADPDWQPVK